ncbi:glutathione S-transferase [Alsobacter soli]|uniref:Glutathione S-transferase n=1 Tax=Alsobacter soli TaxID=2109933 RepID=A0A2T1HLA5_9HYPH|nr:glutathione S-transferase family protein [Alsobacter soli]PSC02420.1 glutathione S-transferase [Alsobacter soli]
MTLLFYGHPFSSYCQKVLVALYENGTAFSWRPLGPDSPENGAALARLWPLGRMPVLVDDGRTYMESSIIIEHLAARRPGPVRLVPTDGEAALETRLLDRVFDNYVHTPMQRIVSEALRPEGNPDPYGVAQAHELLEKAYGWLDERLDGRAWAAGPSFTLADCAAAPALFYADWVHPIPVKHARLRAYRAALLARASFARAVDEARPFRSLFPLGAPDRD